MNRDLLDKLYVPFKLKQRKGPGGMTFEFIPTEDVINRMNVVFDGNWSTKIITQEVIEDFVLIRVQIDVVDGTGNAITHEGYGSAQIQRYSSGVNKGKLLDIGNAYKSAESKAIKNACTRFGVGLYFKEAVGSPLPVVPEIPKQQDVLPPSFVPPIEVVKPEPVIQEQIHNLPPFEVPPTPINGTVKEECVTDAHPLSSLPPFSIGDTVKETLKEVPFNTNTPKNSGVSDVQMAALNGILAIKKIPLKELLTKALTSSNMSADTGTIPDSIDNLSYSQAVAVIKYGNSVYRKS